MNRKARMTTGLLAVAMLLCGFAAGADEFDETITLFKDAGQSATFFKDSYGYAVFPTIGKGGLVVGGGHGNGRVYRNGRYVGDTSMTQVSFGLQAGGQAYSQIVFFEDQRAFDDFTKGTFELGADASAVAIKAAATANVGTTGPTKSKGLDKDEAVAKNRGKYHKGFAIFTIVKGGAMAEAAVAGQKFSYAPRGSNQDRVSRDGD
jgi:lipid-binding SYLF domain-containing protein